MRINKYLAHEAGYSRRQADLLVKEGRVRINGVKAVIGSQIKPTDEVLVDGNKITPIEAYTYLLFHKPVHYVCSRRAQGNSPTIYDLLPKNFRQLKTVGRLDRDSSGLLLLTNDGDFSHRMTHPSFHKTKIYQLELDKPLEPLHQQMISDHGVKLEDGISKFLIMKHGDGYEVTMSEGRNRQIRRTFSALGYTVTKLHRTTFGPYSLGELKPGHTEKTNLK